MTCTLAQIRQYASSELSGEGVGGYFSGISDTTARIDILVDTKWPVNSTLDLAEQWQDAWLLRPNAALATDRLRLISQYTPGGGIFVPDLPYTNPANGESYEVHTVIEPDTALLKYINLALQRTMIQTEFSFVPIGGATWHSMSLIAPWLTNASWVRQIGWLSGSEDRTQTWPYERVVRGEAIEEDGTVILAHPDHVWGSPGSSTNPYTIYVRAMMPAYYGCMQVQQFYGAISSVVTNGSTWTIQANNGTAGLQPGQQVLITGTDPAAYSGTWVVVAVPDALHFVVANNLQPGPIATGGVISANHQQNGLVRETDVAPVRVEWAAWGTIVEAWRHYGQVLDTQARTRLLPNRQEAADMFTKWTRDQGKWPKLTFRPLLAGGPLNIGFGGTPFAYRATTA